MHCSAYRPIRGAQPTAYTVNQEYQVTFSGYFFYQPVIFPAFIGIHETIQPTSVYCILYHAYTYLL